MTRLVNSLRQLDISPELSSQLAEFVRVFEKWNASINLSAARSTTEIEDHVVDCLHVVPHLRASRRVVDIGAGGGLPVAVAAICLPESRFTALEPVHKKHAFLRTVARELKLENLEAFAIRADELPLHDFDAATSRATFDLREWLELGRTLVHPGGLVLGFEAVPRDDLSLPFERHAYPFAGKQRAIIVARRPAMD